MSKLYQIKRDNKGLSLVELIIAISVGVIVSASIASLIAFSIRSYHNQSVNTAMQYEIQTNINQVMDAIMSSSGLVIVQGADKTDYAGFGHFTETRNAVGAVTSVSFTGIVLASGDRDATKGTFDIYMRRVDGSAENPAGTGTDAEKAVQDAVSAITSEAVTDKRPFLLGQNAKEFKLTVETDPAKSSCIVSAPSESDPGAYINPLSVDVELEFEKDGTGRTINKSVKDNAIMRNKVTADIWIGGKRYVLSK